MMNETADTQNLPPDEAAARLLGLLQSGEGQALTLRAEAVALQRRAAELLDRADHLEHVERLRAVLLALDEQYEAALEEEGRLETALAAAIKAERRAEDAARAATANHRQAVEAERRGQRRGTPAEQTGLLATMRAAADVKARHEAAHEGARGQRLALERQLADARERVIECERASQGAGELVKNPPTAPMSTVTGVLDGARRLLHGGELDGDARGGMLLIVAELARRTGLERSIRAEAREAVTREIAERRLERIMPAPGHPLHPSSTSGTRVIPVAPPRG
jgi:hypothetical protein